MFRTKTDVISKILSATDKMNVKCFEILVGSYVIVSSTFNEIILGLFIAIKVDIKYNKKFFKIIGLYKSQTFHVYQKRAVFDKKEKMLPKIRKNSSTFLGERTPQVCCTLFARTARIFQEDVFQIFTPTIFQDNIPQEQLF